MKINASTNESLMVVPVFGEAMSPLFCPGDIISISETGSDHLICFGEPFLIETEELKMIRFIRKGQAPGFYNLRSARPDRFEDIEIPVSKIKRLYTIRGTVRVTA